MSDIDPLVADLLSNLRYVGAGAPSIDALHAAKAARISAVLAAARAACDKYAGPGLRGEDYDPDAVCALVCDLCNALAAADGAR